jgi:hypothetical protein
MRKRVRVRKKCREFASRTRAARTAEHPLVEGEATLESAACTACRARIEQPASEPTSARPAVASRRPNNRYERPTGERLRLAGRERLGGRLETHLVASRINVKDVYRDSMHELG